MISIRAIINLISSFLGKHLYFEDISNALSKIRQSIRRKSFETLLVSSSVHYTCISI